MIGMAVCLPFSFKLGFFRHFYCCTHFGLVLVYFIYALFLVNSLLLLGRPMGVQIDFSF